MTAKELEDVQLMFSRNRETTVTYIFDKVTSFAHLWLVQGIEQHNATEVFTFEKGTLLGLVVATVTWGRVGTVFVFLSAVV